MIVLVARYHVKPGQRGAVEVALRQMAPLVKEREPGCLRYEVNRSTENPDVFLLYEQYADQAALEAHRATPHFQTYIEGTIAPLLERRDREFFEPLIS